MSNVKQLRTRGFIRPEPAAALRQIADDIEAGLFGKVEAVAVVLTGSDVAVFGAGPESSPAVCALLFEDAFQRMKRETLWDLRPGAER